MPTLRDKLGNKSKGTKETFPQVLQPPPAMWYCPCRAGSLRGGHSPANQSNSITGAPWLARKQNVCICYLQKGKINPCHQNPSANIHKDISCTLTLFHRLLQNQKLFVSLNREFLPNSWQKEKKSKICRGWRYQGDVTDCYISQYFLRNLLKRA